ncbi:hypothetical protein [Psychroserpens sp. NJDZ02]|uniref:hypothetical protein n=1 Tax=Psychroserpens sp. NJDZ02 TaxID=2570561 RepID=UPI0010A870E2|nr:hypothetical protein [Psychroserpens sp. NJDZ02]QCE42353.1 hypothetical protein E9099_13380 [Psychroserpens sp. NJDZ02]
MNTLNKNFKLILSLMVVLGTVFTSCNPNEDVDMPDVPVDNPSGSQLDLGATIQRDFMGRIVDENNLPIENTVVSIGSKIASTDANGMFIIKNTSVKEKQAYIIADKSGYLKGMRTVVPTQGANMIKIMLIQDNVIATIPSGSVSDVVLPNGTKVTFDGSFKDDNGNAYSGNVAVIMYYLDPSNPDINSIMPGSLQAVNEQGEARVLESYGMLNVELRGDAGQELNIADGHFADIEMPVDPAQTGVAPVTIPLWHFDEVNGYWVEDGLATLIGGKYVGEVSHFSWWNCDAQFPTVALCMTIVDGVGVPFSNINVELWRGGATYPRVGSSNGFGEICGLIPANEVLTLKAFDQCGVEVYTSAIGPFSTDTNYGDITMAAVSSTSITGTLIDCNDLNVTNGYATINYGGIFSSVAVTNGDFTFNVTECTSLSGFTLEGVNYDTLQVTTVLPFSFDNPNVGNLIACNGVTEFVSVQIDNDPVDYYLINLNGRIGSDGLSFNVNTQTAAGNGLAILGQSIVPGTYTSSSANSFYVETGINMDFGMPDTLQFTLSNFGAIGEYIDMVVTGGFVDNNGVSRDLSITIHMLRDF